MSMNRVSSEAARLPEGERKALAVRALTEWQVITERADELGVSRKFVRTRTHRLDAALDATFARRAVRQLTGGVRQYCSVRLTSR